jgi:integrase
VRYIYTILRSALSDAVKHGRLTLNPTDRSTPPSPSEARPPEMQAWTAPELSRFLHWAEARDPDLAMGWRLLAATGMRRGEALALRWPDVDLEAGRLQVRRSLSTVKTKSAGEQLVEGPTKTGQARVVDIDADTIAALRAYRAVRGLGTWPQPCRFSRIPSAAHPSPASPSPRKPPHSSLALSKRLPTPPASGCSLSSAPTKVAKHVFATSPSRSA